MCNRGCSFLSPCVASGLLIILLPLAMIGQARLAAQEPHVLAIQEIKAFGDDQGRGNLVAIQPYMLTRDYATQERFRRKLDAYFAVAAGRGWFNAKTIVVLPEYIGTWLVAVDEAASVFQAKTVTRAMMRVILSQPWQFLRQWWAAGEKDRAKAAIFRMKAKKMAAVFHAVFSGLATKYRVTVVAGSIVLSGPLVRDGILQAGDGELYNISVIYRPDGRAAPQLVRKAFPIDSELPFTCPAPVDSIPVFTTPAGKLGVLICADAWYPASYATLREQEADFVVVPSYLTPAGIWTRPWRGYNGAPPPGDVAVEDPQHITEREAWLKYGLAGRLTTAGAGIGVNVFLRGTFWDLGADGRTLIVYSGEVYESKAATGAALYNLWLPEAGN